MGLASPTAEFRGVTRNNLDGAESSSSVPVPESTLTFSLVSDIVSYNIDILAWSPKSKTPLLGLSLDMGKL